MRSIGIHPLRCNAAAPWRTVCKAQAPRDTGNSRQLVLRSDRCRLVSEFRQISKVRLDSTGQLNCESSNSALPPALAGGNAVSNEAAFSAKLEADFADELNNSSALVDGRDLSVVSSADAQIGIGERWMVDEVRCIRGQVKTYPLIDGERFVD